MKKVIRRFSYALALVPLTLSPVTAQANLGYSHDFYYAKACLKGPGNDGQARLDVTNYDKGSGQEYHIDMDPGGHQGGTYLYVAYRSYFNGVNQNRTNDYYIYVPNYLSLNTVKAEWKMGNGSSTYCTLSL